MVSGENAGDAVLSYAKIYVHQDATPAATEKAHSRKALCSTDLLSTLPRRWKEAKLG